MTTPHPNPIVNPGFNFYNVIDFETLLASTRDSIRFYLPRSIVTQWPIKSSGTGQILDASGHLALTVENYRSQENPNTLVRCLVFTGKVVYPLVGGARVTILHNLQTLGPATYVDREVIKNVPVVEERVVEVVREVEKHIVQYRTQEVEPADGLMA